ncbi:unnamed protein product [Penicillium olsonii]|nr:unnamed protein product [Penicillium olsonii]
MRLVPMFVLLYLVAYIDKTNIGNAKIEGLLPSLGMGGIQYNIALSIFFIPYVPAAGFLPGAVLVISKWYLPNETQTRIAILYTSAASGGAFSGLLAYVIAKMDGTAGYEGWRWIFIIEGLATILMAVACYTLLLDSPSLSPGWLSPEEIRFLELRQM